MKKSTPIFMSIMLFCFATGIMYYGCKKKDSSASTTTTPAPTTSVLCNGNGSSSYLPLAANDNWHYHLPNASYDEYDTLTGTTVYSSNTYFNMHIVDGNYLNDYYNYFRVSAGTVYSYYTSLSAEYMLIPASPTVNQSWAYPAAIGMGTRKVISTSASISTPSCSYTGCLEIQEYNSSGVPQDLYYYKTGIGVVDKQTSATAYNLVQVTLH